MMYWSKALLVVLALSFAATTSAQHKVTNGNLKESRDDLISATTEHKKTSQALAALQEQELNTATEKVAQLRQLVSEGLIARNELEDSEKSLDEIRERLAATLKKVADSDQLIADVRASEELAKKEALQARAATRSLVRPVLMRYNGTAQWSVANLANVQGFFLSKFGRSLPLSTVGQSATHNRLGWDHRHAADVGLHPDSVEGRALVTYLQSQGIPFLAFRSAVPGVSTGPHIHIGTPSHRLS